VDDEVGIFDRHDMRSVNHLVHVLHRKALVLSHHRQLLELDLEVEHLQHFHNQLLDVGCLELPLDLLRLSVQVVLQVNKLVQERAQGQVHVGYVVFYLMMHLVVTLLCPHVAGLDNRILGHLLLQMHDHGLDNLTGADQLDDVALHLLGDGLTDESEQFLLVLHVLEQNRAGHVLE
jgi:hypothetical protein